MVHINQSINITNLFIPSLVWYVSVFFKEKKQNKKQTARIDNAVIVAFHSAQS